METTNAAHLAADLVERLEQLYVEPTAASFREFFGKPYAGFCNGFGSVQCSLRGVRIVPSGEDGMDLTWSKFIKFCRENGLIEEGSACHPESAQSTAAAATAADPAAASPAATSTTSGMAEDAAASTPELSTEFTQASPSAPCSPADSDTAAPLACAPDAPATPAAGFDYSGLDRPTVDTLHLAEKIIRTARQKYIVDLAGAVDMAHRELVRNSDGHNQHTEETFIAWCRSVSISKTTAYQLLQVQTLISGATPEEQAVLEAASPSLLYAAAKPSAPAQLVQGVKDGDITTNKQYQELLAQLKAKEQELADEKAAHEAESKACSIALQEEYQRRQQAEEARDKAEKTGQTAQKSLAEVRDELRTKNQRIKELEARPIEVRGADPDDIARWRSEGAKPVQDKLDQAQAEAAKLREQLRESQAGKQDSADELGISKQIVSSLEDILRARFETLDSLDYDTFEAAVEPFEGLRDRLNEALEFGSWPKGKEVK